MKIIQRYILFSVTGTFLITLLVMTGILCLGNLLRVADLILRGMDPALVLRFFGFLVISLLEYAIPMAILTAAILVFGRLSADNEITGMRACGIGLGRIIGPVIFLGLVLTLVCLYLQNTAIPNYGFATRQLRARIGLQDPDALLQPGETIVLPGYTINFERKEDDVLHRVQINQYEQRELVSTTFAKMAEIELDRDGENLNLRLIDGTLEEIPDRSRPQIRTTTSFGRFNYPINLEQLYASGQITEDDKRKRDRTSGELLLHRRKLREQYILARAELESSRPKIDRIFRDRRERERTAAREMTVAGLFPAPVVPSLQPANPFFPRELYPAPAYSFPVPRSGHFTFRAAQLPPTTPELAAARDQRRRLTGEIDDLRRRISLCDTEFQKRLSLSAACLSMILISIPLAIQTHRGEKTIGMALSLALIFFFYVFIAYADAVGDEPEKLPFLIVWLPNFLFSAAGVFWMVKFTRI